MAKKKAPVRKYKFSDGRLAELATEKAAFLTRDLADLAEFGITAAKISAFRAADLAFENLPTDTEEVGDQSEATADKDAKADQLRESVRNLRVRVIAVFGEDSPTYRKLGTKDLTALDDANLVKVARRAGRVCDEKLAALASEGLTAAMLTAHEALVVAFQAALELVADEKSDRDDKQQVRVEAGNALFDTMTKYCSYGQRKFFALNEAKYNDYIIYNTPSGTNEDPPAPDPGP